MKTFNKTELKAARTILKEVLKKGRFVWNDKHVATVTVKALDMLIINGYGTGGLKFSSLTEDEQDLTRIISFNRGYNGVRFSRDDLFFVETRADMDDFGFDNGAITKLVVALFKTEVLPWYESQYPPNSDHHFDYIDSCNIFGWYTKSRENCYKLAMKIVKEYLKEESTVEETTTAVAKVTQDTAQPAEDTGATTNDVIESTEQPASSEPSNEQLTAEIKVYLGQIGQNIIEVGTRLIIMKGRLQHGEFGNWLKENFQLTERTAQRFIACAGRFSKPTTSSLLKSSQMFELLALPADETEQFIEEKAAAGTPVEDMTVKKLREEIQQWKARAEEADKKIADSNVELSETKSELQDARNARDAAVSAARDAEEKLKNQQPQVVIQAPDDYDATKQALKDAQTQNQQLQEQLADRPVEVQVPADYHENKKALAEAQEELASNRKVLADAQGQIAELTAQAYDQNNERFSAEEYAAVAQKLDTISAMITEVVLKKSQGFSCIISDYRKNNPQRLEQIIKLFKDFISATENKSDF